MIRTHAESIFRKEVAQAMEGHCLYTWHEDRIISPGVPDLHYVCKGLPGEYRVGWLELKAISAFGDMKRVHVEPSQHQYARKWGPHMPIHFLVKVGKKAYLIPSSMSREISLAVDASYLAAAADHVYDMATDFHTLPDKLKTITRIHNGTV
jgi:hypothetical protein